MMPGPSPLQEDELELRPAGNVRTVDGLLDTFRILGAAKREQRRVLAIASADPALRGLLEPHADELRRRGLLD